MCTFVWTSDNKLVAWLLFSLIKVKWSRYRPGVAQRVGRVIALLFHDRGTRREVSGQQHTPAALYPRERPGTHFTGGWVGPRASLDGRKNLVPTGIQSRTVQPAVSCLYHAYYLCIYITSTLCVCTYCYSWWLHMDQKHSCKKLYSTC